MCLIFFCFYSISRHPLRHGGGVLIRQCPYEICFKIDQLFSQHFVYYVESLSSPPSFLCSQKITPFINSMIFINQEKGFEFQPIVKPLYPFSCSSVEFLLSLSYKGLKIRMKVGWLGKTALIQIMKQVKKKMGGG